MLEATINEIIKTKIDKGGSGKKKKKRRQKSSGPGGDLRSDDDGQPPKQEKKSKWRRRPVQVKVDIEEGFVDKVKILESKLASRFNRQKAVIGHHYL